MSTRAQGASREASDEGLVARAVWVLGVSVMVGVVVVGGLAAAALRVAVRAAA